MTAQETYDVIIKGISTQILDFNNVVDLDYEIFNLDATPAGMTQTEYDNLVAEAYNWDDTFMDDVNDIGAVAGIKPKKREGDPTQE